MQRSFPSNKSLVGNATLTLKIAHCFLGTVKWNRSASKSQPPPLHYVSQGCADRGGGPAGSMTLESEAVNPVAVPLFNGSSSTNAVVLIDHSRRLHYVYIFEPDPWKPSVFQVPLRRQCLLGWIKKEEEQLSPHKITAWPTATSYRCLGLTTGKEKRRISICAILTDTTRVCTLF